MLKKLFILAALLLAVCGAGCENTIKPETAVQNFVNSVSFNKETGELSFTVPKGLSPKHSFYLHVSGRIKMGDGGMSIHLFEEESENNGWEPGKSYSHEFGKDALLEALIIAGIQEYDKPGELLNEIQIGIDENGNIKL